MKLITVLSILCLIVSGFSISLMSGLYVVWDLGGSQYLPVYTISFYAIGNALSIPLGKFFGTRFGNIRSITVCLIFFSIFTLLCGLAPNLIVFLIYRLLQGIAGGPIYTLLPKIVPKESLKYYTPGALTIFTIAPILAACFGGTIAYEFDWRYIFYIVFPIPLVLALFLWKEDFEKTNSSLDVIGYIFYALGLFSISFAIITGEELDWYRSKLIVSSLIIGSISLIFFFLWSRLKTNPLFNFNLFKHPIFTFGIVNLVILFSAYFGTIILLALWLTLYIHYNAIWVAVLIGTMAASGILPALLVTHRKLISDARIPLSIAIVFLIISSFHTSTFNDEVDFNRIAVSRLTAGFGLALFLPPLFRLCFRNFEEQHQTDVLTLFQVFRCIASGIGAAVFSIIWHRREIFYHERLGSSLTMYSEKTRKFFSQAKEFAITGEHANIQLNDELNRQATSLALDDCFFLIGWILVGLLCFLFLSLFLEKKLFFPEKKTS